MNKIIEWKFFGVGKQGAYTLGAGGFEVAGLSFGKKQVTTYFRTIMPKMVSAARSFCPVRTGALRDSITYIIDDNGDWAAFGANKEYAIFVEYGTSKMAARPFLRNAMVQVLKK